MDCLIGLGLILPQWEGIRLKESFPPPSSSPLFLLVEHLVKAEGIDLSVTKDISDRNVLWNDSGHLFLLQMPSTAESWTEIELVHVSAQNLVAIYIPVAWLELLTFCELPPLVYETSSRSKWPFVLNANMSRSKLIWPERDLFLYGHFAYRTESSSQSVLGCFWQGLGVASWWVFLVGLPFSWCCVCQTSWLWEHRC